MKIPDKPEDKPEANIQELFPYLENEFKDYDRPNIP